MSNNVLLYPAGHNVVLYSMGDDKQQTLIPGVEGSEGITALAVSPSKNFLAVCERAERAICTIYEIKGTTYKKRKMLSQSEYPAKEFITAAFSSQEKSLLVTINSQPKWAIIVWMWDKAKCLCHQVIGITGAQEVY